MGLHFETRTPEMYDLNWAQTRRPTYNDCEDGFNVIAHYSVVD
jgi:hypothetical protein